VRSSGLKGSSIPINKTRHGPRPIHPALGRHGRSSLGLHLATHVRHDLRRSSFFGWDGPEVGLVGLDIADTAMSDPCSACHDCHGDTQGTHGMGYEVRIRRQGRDDIKRGTHLVLRSRRVRPWGNHDIRPRWDRSSSARHLGSQSPGGLRTAFKSVLLHEGVFQSVRRHVVRSPNISTVVHMHLPIVSS
jgi:hypothetical protein